MKKLSFVTKLFIGLGLVGICGIAYYVGCFFLVPDYPMSADRAAVHNFIGRTEKALTKKYKVRTVSDSVSMPGGPVRELGLSFQINHPLTKKEARQLYVNISQDFLKMLNNDQELKPYLTHWPFTIEDADIGIFSTDARGEGVYDPFISVVGNQRDKVVYHTEQEGAKGYGYKSTCYETYEEAVRLAGLE